jgi:hypothetical protein
MRVKAQKLLRSSNRFDLGIKINYARSYVELGNVPSRYLSDYLTHIKFFNSFSEQEPKKSSPVIFVREFNQLIDNLKQNGFDKNQSKIQISGEGEIINAAHRVAACSVLNIEADAEVTPGSFELYDFKYFLDSKIPEAVMRASLFGYSSVVNNLRLIIIWPVTPNSLDDFIVDKIEESVNVFCKFEFAPNKNLVNNLKMISYFLCDTESKNSWVGNSGNGFEGIARHTKESMGKNNIRVFVVKEEDEEKIIKVKSELRQKIGLGNVSVHGTDSKEESLKIIQTLFHPESLFCAKTNNFAKFPQIAEWVYQLSQEILQNKLKLEDVIIGGSGPLGAHGVRAVSDFDVIIDNKSKFFSKLNFISFHRIDESEYHSSLQELLHDPEKHFYFLGVKFISLSEMYDMKKNRNEWPKDTIDLGMVRRLLKESEKKFSFGDFIDKILIFAYWEVNNYFSKVVTRIKITLARQPVLFRNLKKIKLFVKRRL